MWSTTFVADASESSSSPKPLGVVAKVLSIVSDGAGVVGPTDHSSKPLSQKLIADKPADIHDQCSDGIGQVLPGTEACQAIVQAYQTPRMVAGESITTDANKCRLKQLLRTDYYPVQFTDAQWATMQAIFPDGVCDFSKAGVDQQGTIPWQTYQDDSNGGSVIYGGRPLGVPPASR